jgi:hypothetical protein
MNLFTLGRGGVQPVTEGFHGMTECLGVGRLEVDAKEHGVVFLGMLPVREGGVGGDDSSPSFTSVIYEMHRRQK